MTKFFLISVLTSVLSSSTLGQSLSFFFKNLPADCTPELTFRQRDSLLQTLEFILPGGTSTETVKYTIDTANATNYLRYEYSFTTGQNGFISFELRKFTKADGQSFLVFSRYGGLSRAYIQQDLKVFAIKNMQLVEQTTQKLLPKDIPLSRFLKKETPDAAKKRIDSAVNFRYDLYTEKQNEIEFTMFPQSPIDEDEKWVIGYSFLFTWTGKVFEQKLTDNK
jgi:hypothetical protein